MLLPTLLMGWVFGTFKLIGTPGSISSAKWRLKHRPTLNYSAGVGRPYLPYRYQLSPGVLFPGWEAPSLSTHPTILAVYTPHPPRRVTVVRAPFLHIIGHCSPGKKELGTRPRAPNNASHPPQFRSALAPHPAGWEEDRANPRAPGKVP